MIAHRHSKKWTKVERARADRMAEEIGCIFCQLETSIKGPCEVRHHIISGNKRMGHWFTLPVCEPHHTACHNGTYSHAVQIDTWIKVQHALEMSDELPPSKIFPRAVYPLSEATNNV